MSSKLNIRKKDNVLHMYAFMAESCICGIRLEYRKRKNKITEMYTSINGELCKIDKAYSGEIVILQNEF